jgi:hypothetical protein
LIQKSKAFHNLKDFITDGNQVATTFQYFSLLSGSHNRRSQANLNHAD